MLFQAIHNELAQLAGLALALRRIQDEGLGFVDNLLHLADGNWPLLAGAQQSVQHFLAVEFFAASIFLHHHVRNFVDALVGRKALLALQAFPAPADCFALFTLSGIHYFVVYKPTKRAFHGKCALKTKQKSGVNAQL